MSGAYIDDAMTVDWPPARTTTDGNDVSVLFVSPFTRLDNEAELAQALDLPPATDVADILCAGWTAYGVDLADRLRGDFAFALSDRGAGCLYLARDVFGVCPFYIARPEGRIIFGSSARTVRDRLDGAFTLNETMIADFLVGAVCDTEATYVEEVRRVPPAHWIRIDPTGETRTRFWELSQIAEQADPPDVVATFREMFDAAVRARVVPDRTWLMVSGGLDSSALIGSVQAQALQQDRLSGASMTYYDTPGWNDRAPIEAMVDALDIELTAYPSDTVDPLSDMPRFIAAMDGPFLSYGQVANGQIPDGATARGFTHLLSGHGGDEVISYGVGRLNELARAGRWWTVWTNIGGMSGLNGRSDLTNFKSFLVHIRTVRKLQSLLRRAKALLKPRTRPQTRSAPLSTTTGQGEFDRLSPRLRERLDPARYVYKSVSNSAYHTERDIQRELLEQPFQPMTLEITVLTSQVAGVQTVLPFFDRALAEYSYSLPSKYKLENGMTRAILRDAMADRVPDTVWRRTDKFDFSDGFKNGLRQAHDTVLEMTDPQAQDFAPYLDIDHLNALRRRFSEAPDTLSIFDYRFLWRVATLGMWFAILAQSEAARAAPGNGAHPVHKNESKSEIRTATRCAGR